MSGSLWSRVRGTTRSLLAPERAFALTLRLTLVLLILYPHKEWDMEVPIRILAGIGLIAPRIRSHAAFWFVISAVWLYGSFQRVYTIDNHKILTGYWCVAITLALEARAAKALWTSARLLIALTFVFATVWKATNPEFIDGSFMQYTMMTDGRFANFTKALTGFCTEARSRNSAATQQLVSERAEVVDLESTQVLDVIAVGSTWSTLLLEATIGISFLLAHRFRMLRHVRNLSLMAFMWTTYAIATVIGFGSLLSIMGYAQCRPEEAKSRAGYLLSLAALQLFTIPWSRVL